jgi:hypothetical protein
LAARVHVAGVLAFHRRSYQENRVASWYLTLPTGQPGSPDTVKLPTLKTYSGPWFRLNEARDGVVFSAPCGGVATKGSNYPRSELRQCNEDGSLASWGNAGVGQTLTVEQAITKLPSAKPQVVGCQIHDAKSDVIEVMASGQQLVVRYDDDQKTAVIDPAYVLGTRYQVKIVAAIGRIRIFYNGAQKLDIPAAGTGWYWKVGAYVQSNPSKGDKPDTVGEVVVYSAAVTHAS